MSIDILLHNDAGVPVALLTNAAARVASVFRTAGINATASQAEHVQTAVNAFQLTVVITAGWPDRNTAADKMLGIAPEAHGRCGRVAYVLWDRISQYARGRRRDSAVVLAMVIAHEIGHLLLPPGSHAMVGLMRADWKAEDFADAESSILGFSAAESARMRERLRRELGTTAE